MKQMLKLSDKYFNAAIIKMLQQPITNSLEIHEKSFLKISVKKQKFWKESNGNYKTENQ